jgi:hypothetical protein
MRSAELQMQMQMQALSARLNPALHYCFMARSAEVRAFHHRRSDLALEELNFSVLA